MRQAGGSRDNNKLRGSKCLLNWDVKQGYAQMIRGITGTNN